MNPTARRLVPLIIGALVVIVALVLLFGGGGSPTPSPSPSASPSALPSASPSPSLEPSPSASASDLPSASPSAAPTPSPSAEACTVTPETGLIASDRVVSVEVSTSSTVDFVTFVFDDGSLSPAGPPRGDLTVAEPPFTYASSGLPIELAGDHALQVRFSGMSLSNDVGEPTFTGDPDISVDYPALKQAIMYDESEGIAGWYIGYDGTGCVDLVKDGNDIVVTIAHP
jgi:hypothetical protein